MSEQPIDCKVVLLGDTYVGKSAIFDRIINDNFNTEQKQTVGVSFAMRTIEVNSDHVYLGLWDTAGQERFRAMAKMYYRKANAALLCYDISSKESFEKLNYWVSELRENEESCKIYLVATKVDLAEEGTEKPSKENAQEFAESINAQYFRTSAKKDIGITELFDKIAKDYLEEKKDEITEENEITDLNNFNGKKNDGCC
ncbi:ras-related protein rab-24 [Anaeramoeba flamelloides]|uniref:Ras-related protein rab-24 n=1 Tax=Anaeramoeba flamelloides TaxID=1746091 RepID=A0AAV7ZJ71_9EUKA|nr:ras-related protein rab-24 [Anaeramoeba flamelloides]KAJ6239685.1 ras-related protein rab-24 [Anaeramoeba flamelloides]